MPQFLITWDSGYGLDVEVIDVENIEEAKDFACQNWRCVAAAESSALYDAEHLTSALCADYGLDPEDYGLLNVKSDD